LSVNRFLFIVVCFALSLLGLANLAVYAEEDGAETDVVNSNHGNVRQFAAPGDSFVVVQDVSISDAGEYGDDQHDDCDTLIESMTIRKAGGTLALRHILQVRLYQDDGDGSFEVLDDALLGAFQHPDISDTFDEDGLTFTNGEGKTFVMVPNGHDRQFFVVVDFSTEAPHGATLRTSFDVQAAEDLTNGTGCTSAFDPSTRLPLLSADNGIKYTTIAAATGDDEVDVIDETLSRDVKLGQSVILQQFVIADPGPNGDADGDGHPTLVRAITVRVNTGDESDKIKIKRLRLFRESARTKPGWQEQDDLLSTINNPKWDDLMSNGVVFTKGGRLLLRVPDNFRERLYIIADLATDGFSDESGDGKIHLSASIEILARDDLIESPTGDHEDDGDCLFVCGRSDEASSGIETKQPVDTRGELAVEVPAPKITLSNLELARSGKVIVRIDDMPGNGLGRMSGTFVFDPNLIKVRLTPQGEFKVKALGPYNVLFKSEVDEVEETGQLAFEIELKNGTDQRQPLNAGAILEIEMEPVVEREELQSVLCQASEVTINSEVSSIALEDKDENPIAEPDVRSGLVRINVLGGDVDLNGVVNRKDVRWVSLYIMEKLNPTSDLGVDEDIFEKAADVAPLFGEIDSTDVRHIKETVFRRRTLVSACDNPVDPIPPSAAMNLKATESKSPKVFNSASLAITKLLARFDTQTKTIEFAAEGRAIAGLEIELYNLSGLLILKRSVNAARLKLSLSEGIWPWANGIYLYRVTVNGAQGEKFHGHLEKFILKR
jgi:hypothetical protein